MSKPDPLAGQIQLNVVVTGKQGAPVSGLTATDFKVLDNKKEQSILSFQAVDLSAGATGQPVQVLLLLDLVNMPVGQAGIARLQMQKFLAQNGGHLPYPTSIMVLSEDGLRIQPHPSTEGNALAAALNQAAPTAHTTGLGEVGRFQLSVRSLASIAENEVKSPGRKILIWSGPGWPMMAGANYRSSTQDRQRAFDTIVEISTRLREAQIAIYNVSISESANGQTRGAIATQAPMAMPAAEGGQTSRTGPPMGEGTEAPNYKEFVKGVKTPRQAETANLALQVMAVQSGGRVLDPTNDLAAQITKCVQEMNSFYTVSFRPAPSDHPEEYHEVTVQVARPGVAARTFSGYYSQP